VKTVVVGTCGLVGVGVYIVGYTFVLGWVWNRMTGLVVLVYFDFLVWIHTSLLDHVLDLWF
jgi:hypothetical protein